MAPRDKRLTLILGCVGAVSQRVATCIAVGSFDLEELNASSQQAHDPASTLSVPFDSLVVSASSESAENERRSAAHLLASLPKSVSPAGLQAIVREEMFVGLEAQGLSLRVLGAASRNSSLLARSPIDPSAEAAYREWHDSLCPQARMAGHAMGITIGAATIALANDYYSMANPDLCGQTVRLSACSFRASRESKTTPLAAADPTGDGLHRTP